jgi:hypothetical protein
MLLLGNRQNPPLLLFCRDAATRESLDQTSATAVATARRTIRRATGSAQTSVPSLVPQLRRDDRCQRTGASLQYQSIRRTCSRAAARRSTGTTARVRGPPRATRRMRHQSEATKSLFAVDRQSDRRDEQHIQLFGFGKRLSSKTAPGAQANRHGTRRCASDRTVQRSAVSFSGLTAVSAL